jgi:hypothetical protein
MGFRELWFVPDTTEKRRRQTPDRMEATPLDDRVNTWSDLVDAVYDNGLLEHICSKEGGIWEHNANNKKRKAARLLKGVVAIRMVVAEEDWENLTGPQVMQWYNRLALEMKEADAHPLAGQGAAVKQMSVIMRKVHKCLKENSLLDVPKEELLSALLPENWLVGVKLAEDPSRATPLQPLQSPPLIVRPPPNLSPDNKRRFDEIIAELRGMGAVDVPTAQRARTAEAQLPTPETTPADNSQVSAPHESASSQVNDPDDAASHAVYRSLDGAPTAPAYRSLGANNNDEDKTPKFSSIPINGTHMLIAQLNALGCAVEAGPDEDEDPISAAALAAAGGF